MTLLRELKKLEREFIEKGGDNILIKEAIERIEELEAELKEADETNKTLDEMYWREFKIKQKHAATIKSLENKLHKHERACKKSRYHSGGEAHT